MRFLGLSVLGLLAAAPPAFAASYTAYPTAVTGTTGQVALGGAAVAFPEGGAAAFTNPAGLSSVNDPGVGFVSDSSQVQDFVVDLDRPRLRALNIPLKYSYTGAWFISRQRWGVGVMLQTPYELDQTFLNQGASRRGRRGDPPVFSDQTQVKIGLNSYTLAAGRSCLDNRMAFGLALKYNQIRETFDFTSPDVSTLSVHQDATNAAWSADVGLLGRPWPELQLGLMYRMGYQVPFDPALNRGLPLNATWFRDVQLPHRVLLGTAWLPNNKFHLFVQSNYIFQTSQTILAGTGMFPGRGQAVPEGRFVTVDGHWGAELIPIDEPDLTIRLWAGGYLEKTRIEGGFSRYHHTAGFSFNPWVIDVSVAIDRADLYNNFSAGLGVDLLGAFKRVAKRYHWNLPV